MSRPRPVVARAALPLVLVMSLLAGCQSEEVVRPAYFTDVASEVGLDFEHSAFHWDVSADLPSMMGGGLCWIDYDDDGWLDLFLTNTWTGDEWGRWYASDGIPTSALYRNDRGEFESVTEEAGVATELRGNGCVAADFDLDGHTDLYVTSDRENALFWNNGDGTFTEGAEEAGADDNGWHTGALVGDFNGDLWPDMFVAGYADINSRIPGAIGGFPNTFFPVRDLFYLNEGPGPDGRVTFREVGEAVGLDVFSGLEDYEYGLGGAVADFDGDADLDLYVANDTNPNRLYENVAVPGGVASDPLGIGFRFAHVLESGADDDNSGMGVAAGDYTGDGRADLFVTNLGSQLHSVYVNQTESTLVFEDGSASLGSPDLGGDFTGWGATWADIDLDTDLDLVLANGRIPLLDRAADAEPMQVLANQVAQSGFAEFLDVSADLGLSELGPLLARGSAVADYDNDGDLDVAVNSIGSPVRLLRNDVGGRWLIVALGGFHPGATVTAVLTDGTEMVRTITAGSSYLSSEDPRAHFGLGDAEGVTQLKVRWPDGTETVAEDVGRNRIVTIDPPA